MSKDVNSQFVLAVASEWAVGGANHEKRIHQHLFPLGPSLPALHESCCIHVKLRLGGTLRMDDAAELVRLKGELFIKSALLCDYAVSLADTAPYILLFLEGSPSAARCVVTTVSDDFFDVAADLDTPIRLTAFDLPPREATVVEAEDVYAVLHESLSGGDPELFGTAAEQFLSAPHILIPLFAHVLSLSSKETIDFPLLLRTTAEQLRVLLLDESFGPSKIQRVRRDHQKLWASVIGERVAFVDGGVARISGLADSEPQALRVGVYSVIPGETDISKREDWSLTPFVVGDITVDCSSSETEPPDRKRLLEAARYVLEPLTALGYLERFPSTAYTFLHGPLITQFTQYDEGEPNFLPCLAPAFLNRYGLSKDWILENISGVPHASSGPLWNQFMAVYAGVCKRIADSVHPLCGVVERSAGRWLAQATLDLLVERKQITQAHAKKIHRVLERYEISDDFLFGCILKEGEYLTPIELKKNRPTRARERWQTVVGGYPAVFATVIKTAEANFPYRIEMNKAALAAGPRLLELLYHTSRLLPRYAFPVGLDIVDKYAKVPDWLSKGISGRIAAGLLSRALRTGDVNIVAQLRQFLSHTPRDFFYRPQP